MAELWVVISAATVAVWGLYGAIAFRAGRLRRMGRWYFDRSQSFFLRNSAFSLLLAGAFCAAGLLILLLADSASIWAQTIVAAATFIAFVSIILGIAWTVRPPAWLKPSWITERERTDSP